MGGVTRPDGVTTPTSEWLHSVLLPKVVQWAEESGRSQGIPRQQPPLVPLDKYCSLYRELKEKYGPALIKVGALPMTVMEPDSCMHMVCSTMWHQGEKDRVGYKTFLSLDEYYSLTRKH